MPDPVVGSDARPRDGGRPVPERKCSRLRSQRPDPSAQNAGVASHRPARGPRRIRGPERLVGLAPGGRSPFVTIKALAGCGLRHSLRGYRWTVVASLDTPAWADQTALG